MAKSAKKSLLREAPAPEPRGAALRGARRRIGASHSGALTTGLTVAHIAREEGLTVTRIRQILAAMLESREIDPPPASSNCRSPGSAKR